MVWAFSWERLVGSDLWKSSAQLLWAGSLLTTDQPQFLRISKDRDSPASLVSLCQSYPPFLEESEISWFLAWAPKQNMAIGPCYITCNFCEGTTELPDIMEKFSPSPPPFCGKVPVTRALITKETGSASYCFYLASIQWVWVHHRDGSELSTITSSSTFQLQWGWGI